MRTVLTWRAAATPMRGLVLVVSLLALLATAVSGPATAVPRDARPAAGLTQSTACADYLLLGARGSGTVGPGTPGWRSAEHPGDPYGLGGEVASAFTALSKAARGAGRTVEIVSVNYAANHVRTLIANPAKYFAGLGAGVTWAQKLLLARASRCPRQLVVLAGYSQGAMVMHRVLQAAQLQAASTVLPRVTTALLIADGDRITHDRGAFFGNGHRISPFQGVAQGLRVVSHASGAKFSVATATRVIAVCRGFDLVCDNTVPLTASAAALAGVAVHLSYTGSPALRQGVAAAVARTVHRSVALTDEQILFSGVDCGSNPPCTVDNSLFYEHPYLGPGMVVRVSDRFESGNVAFIDIAGRLRWSMPSTEYGSTDWPHVLATDARRLVLASYGYGGSDQLVLALAPTRTGFTRLAWGGYELLGGWEFTIADRNSDGGLEVDATYRICEPACRYDIFRHARWAFTGRQWVVTKRWTA